MLEGGPILWILTAAGAVAMVMFVKVVAEEAEKQKLEKAKTESKRSQELQRLERKELNKEIIRETQKRVLHWVKPADEEGKAMTTLTTAYYVNENADDEGDHEVHKTDCYWLTLVTDSSYVGDFSTCDDAVAEARKKYATANGCEHCSEECHTG